MSEFKLDKHSVEEIIHSFTELSINYKTQTSKLSPSLEPLAKDPVSTVAASHLEGYRKSVYTESQRAATATHNASQGLKAVLEQAASSDKQRESRVQKAFSGLPGSASDSGFQAGNLEPLTPSERDSFTRYESSLDASGVKGLLRALEHTQAEQLNTWKELSNAENIDQTLPIQEINQNILHNNGAVFTALHARATEFGKFATSHHHDGSVLRKSVLETATSFEKLKNSVPKLSDVNTAEQSVKSALQNYTNDPTTENQMMLHDEQRSLNQLITQTLSAYSQYATSVLDNLPHNNTITTTPEIISAAGSGAGGSGEKDDADSGKDKDLGQEQAPKDTDNSQGQGAGGAPQGAQGGAPQGGAPQGGQPAGGDAPQGGSESGDKDDDKDSDDKDKDKDDDGKDSKHHHGLPGTHAASAHDKHTPHGGGGGGAGGSATPLSKASIPGTGGASGTQPGVPAPSTAAAAASGGQTGPVGGPAGGMPGGARPGGSSGEKTRSNMFINKTKDDSWVDDEAFDVPIQHTGVADPNNPGSHADPGNNQQNPDQPPRPKFRPGQRPPRNPSE